MKKIIFIAIFAFSVQSIVAQNPNPFKSIGKPAPEFLSLSNGKYPEIFENDTLRKIGSVMFGKYDENGKLIPAPMELVRLAIPRRVYTQSHIEYVIETFKEILKTKNEVKGHKITKEPQFLRHFTSHFKPL